MSDSEDEIIQDENYSSADEEDPDAESDGEAEEDEIIQIQQTQIKPVIEIIFRPPEKYQSRPILTNEEYAAVIAKRVADIEILKPEKLEHLRPHRTPEHNTAQLLAELEFRVGLNPLQIQRTMKREVTGSGVNSKIHLEIEIFKVREMTLLQ